MNEIAVRSIEIVSGREVSPREVTVRAMHGGSRASVYAEIIERMKFRVHEDMLTLRWAVDDAENIITWNRTTLNRIFRKIALDTHLQSQWDTRVKKTIMKQFKVVDKAGNENDELTKLLKAQWFYDLQEVILESKLWGFSVIELGPVLDQKFIRYMDGKGNVHDAITVVDRDYVKPEFNVITNNPEDITGVQIDDPKYQDQLIFVGKTHDFGALMSMARLLLFKDNLTANWSEWAEIFGMDMRVGKTDAEGTDRDRFLNMLKGLGTNGYGLMGLRDEIDFTGTSRTDAYQVYNAYIRYIDEQVSKKIFGQDVISNNTGQVVGKVGEAVSNLYGDSDAMLLRAVINDECFRRFTNLGIGNFEGYFFEHDTTEKVELVARITIDKSINDMGYKLSQKYLEETYGVEIEGEKEITQPEVNPPQRKIKK